MDLVELPSCQLTSRASKVAGVNQVGCTARSHTFCVVSSRAKRLDVSSLSARHSRYVILSAGMAAERIPNKKSRGREARVARMTASPGLNAILQLRRPLPGDGEVPTPARR